MSIRLVFCALLFQTPAFAALNVTIDAGHGGSETGAVHGGVVESKVALQIAKKLFKRLNKDKNFKAQMIRTSNTDVTLEDRVDLSNKFKTDLFISIHANASPNRKARGFELYIQNQLEPEEEAKFLAHTEHSETSTTEKRPKGDVEAILYDLKKSHKILKSYQVSTYMRKQWPGKKRRMIRQGPFFVLSQNEIPAILVEVGYLSNPKERKRLVQKDYQNKIARRIHLGLKDYLRHSDLLTSGKIQ